MAGSKSKSTKPRAAEPWENPNSYALKETAKEMWNAEDFVPAKRSLLNKIREAGPKEEPYESPNWSATKELAAEFADSLLPDNPTQAAAGLVGGRIVGKAAGAAIKKAGKADERAIEKLRLKHYKETPVSEIEKPPHRNWWEGEPIEDDDVLDLEPVHRTPEEAAAYKKEMLQKYQDAMDSWDELPGD